MSRSTCKDGVQARCAHAGNQLTAVLKSRSLQVDIPKDSTCSGGRSLNKLATTRRARPDHRVSEQLSLPASENKKPALTPARNTNASNKPVGALTLAPQPRSLRSRPPHRVWIQKRDDSDIPTVHDDTREHSALLVAGIRSVIVVGRCARFETPTGSRIVDVRSTFATTAITRLLRSELIEARTSAIALHEAYYDGAAPRSVFMHDAMLQSASTLQMHEAQWKCIFARRAAMFEQAQRRLKVEAAREARRHTKIITRLQAATLKRASRQATRRLAALEKIDLRTKTRRMRHLERHAKRRAADQHRAVTELHKTITRVARPLPSLSAGAVRAVVPGDFFVRLAEPKDGFFGITMDGDRACCNFTGTATINFNGTHVPINDALTALFARKKQLFSNRTRYFPYAPIVQPLDPRRAMHPDAYAEHGRDNNCLYDAILCSVSALYFDLPVNTTARQLRAVVLARIRDGFPLLGHEFVFATYTINDKMFESRRCRLSDIIAELDDAERARIPNLADRDEVEKWLNMAGNGAMPNTVEVCVAAVVLRLHFQIRVNDGVEDAEGTLSTPDRMVLGFGVGPLMIARLMQKHYIPLMPTTGSMVSPRDGIIYTRAADIGEKNGDLSPRDTALVLEALRSAAAVCPPATATASISSTASAASSRSATVVSSSATLHVAHDAMLCARAGPVTPPITPGFDVVPRALAGEWLRLDVSSGCVRFTRVLNFLLNGAGCPFFDHQATANNTIRDVDGYIFAATPHPMCVVRRNPRMRTSIARAARQVMRCASVAYTLRWCGVIGNVMFASVVATATIWSIGQVVWKRFVSRVDLDVTFLVDVDFETGHVAPIVRTNMWFRLLQQYTDIFDNVTITPADPAYTSTMDGDVVGAPINIFLLSCYDNVMLNEIRAHRHHDLIAAIVQKCISPTAPAVEINHTVTIMLSTAVINKQLDDIKNDAEAMAALQADMYKFAMARRSIVTARACPNDQPGPIFVPGHSNGLAEGKMVLEGHGENVGCLLCVVVVGGEALYLLTRLARATDFHVRRLSTAFCNPFHRARHDYTHSDLVDALDECADDNELFYTQQSCCSGMAYAILSLYRSYTDVDAWDTMCNAERDEAVFLGECDGPTADPPSGCVQCINAVRTVVSDAAERLWTRFERCLPPLDGGSRDSHALRFSGAVRTTLDSFARYMRLYDNCILEADPVVNAEIPIPAHRVGEWQQILTYERFPAIRSHVFRPDIREQIDFMVGDSHVTFSELRPSDFIGSRPTCGMERIILLTRPPIDAQIYRDGVVRVIPTLRREVWRVRVDAFSEVFSGPDVIHPVSYHYAYWAGTEGDGDASVSNIATVSYHRLGCAFDGAAGDARSLFIRMMAHVLKLEPTAADYRCARLTFTAEQSSDADDFVNLPRRFPNLSGGMPHCEACGVASQGRHRCPREGTCCLVPTCGMLLVRVTQPYTHVYCPKCDNTPRARDALTHLLATDVETTWRHGRPWQSKCLPFACPTREARKEAKVDPRVKFTLIDGQRVALFPEPTKLAPQLVAIGFVDRMPFVTKPSPASIQSTLLGRVLVPPLPAERIEELLPYINEFVDEVRVARGAQRIRATPFTHWNARFPRGKQIAHIHALNNIKNGRFDARWFDRKFFLKTEKLTKDLTTSTYAGRGISSVSAEAQVALGPLMHAYGNFLKSWWSMDNPVNAMNDVPLIYASGCTGEHIGDALHDLEKQGFVNVAEFDYEKFDSRFQMRHLQLAHSMFHALLDYSSAFGNLSRYTLTAQLRSKAQFLIGRRAVCKFAFEGRRNSGDPNTSCENSFMNGIMMRRACRQLGISAVILVCGDDSLILAREPLGPRVEEIRSKIAEVGFSITGGASRGIVGARFLGSVVSRVLDHTGAERRLLVPDARRALCKMGWSLEWREAFQDWTRGVAMSYRDLCAATPVLSNYVTALLRATQALSRRDDQIERMVRRSNDAPQIVRAAGISYRPRPHPDAIYDFCVDYNVQPEEVRALCAQLDEIEVVPVLIEAATCAGLFNEP